MTAVVVVTRHDSHAALAAEALRAGRHVFVEKPLAVSAEQLALVEAAMDDARLAGHAPVLMVGFNRRFAPLSVAIKRQLVRAGAPATFVMTVNAGAIPAGHWTRDPLEGGGRLVGEACHFIDLLRYLAGAPLQTAEARPLSRRPDDDSALLSLTFTNGSAGTIHYLAGGHRSFPKERLEVFCGGRVLQLDNFRVLRAYGWPGVRTQRGWRQDKGHRACAAAFVDAVGTASGPPVAFDEVLEVSRAALRLADQVRT